MIIHSKYWEKFMFRIFKKQKNELETNSFVTNSHKETDRFAQYRTDEKYERLVYDSTIEQLEMIVNILEEPYMLTIEELNYMLAICDDNLRKGYILYGIASCYYGGNRGAEQSLEQALKYDEQASDLNCPPAALRYGVKLLGLIEDRFTAGTIDEEAFVLWQTRAIGEMVKSFNLGNEEKAREVLEILINDHGEFCGCHAVDELINRFSEYQSFSGQK